MNKLPQRMHLAPGTWRLAIGNCQRYLIAFLFFRASQIRGLYFWLVCVRFFDLNKNFALLYQPQVTTCPVFNSSRTRFQVLNFGFHGVIARQQCLVSVALSADHVLQLVHAQPPALTPPQWVLDSNSKHHKNEQKQPHDQSSHTGTALHHVQCPALPLAQIIKSIATRIRRDFGQFFLDTQQLIVFGHAVGTRQRPSLDLHGVCCNGNVGNGGVFGFARAV